MPRDRASAIQTMFSEPRQRSGIDAHAGVVLAPLQPRQVHRRIRVVFAHQRQHARLLFVLFGNLDGLDHGGDHVHRVVLEGDDALRAGSHADAAAPAAIQVGFGRPLGVFVECAERALLGAALALRAALQEERRIREVAPARMHGPSMGRQVDALDGFQRRAHGVLARMGGIHGGARGARRVDSGAARLVGEADEVRVGEAVRRAPAVPGPGDRRDSGSVRCRWGPCRWPAPPGPRLVRWTRPAACGLP